MSTIPSVNEEEFRHIQWSSHYIVKQGSSELNEGDKIVLPATALEQLLNQVGGSSGVLPSPLTFELRHPHIPKAVIHSGVKEFSSSSNTVAQLPQWMMSALDLKQDDHVLIKLKLLPKGTWTRLKPMSEDYREITDYRAALESHLRSHYNTLTKGQILSCRYGGRIYNFHVVDLKPEDAVSITDTDLEVDIDPINNDTTKPTIQSSSSVNIVNLNETVTRTIIAKNEYKYWKLALNVDEQQLKQLNQLSLLVNVDVENGDADIIISKTDKMPTLDNHEWSDLSSNKKKTIQIATTNLLTSSKLIYIGIHGYTENTIVTWNTVFTSGCDDTKVDTIQDNESKEGKVECKNCHGWIAERTLMLHEGFCFRNNVLCPWGCGKVFKKDSEDFREHWHCNQCDYIGNTSGIEYEKHIDYYHTLKTCVCNGFRSSSYEELSKHRQTNCPEKLITCRYCHNLTAQGVISLDARDRLLGLYSHESYCGSRTITCQKCHKSIPIKDIQVHAKIHEVKRQQQVLPPACSNYNCIRPRTRNKLSLCQFCFGPFWIMEDDPKNVKLIQRVARKIHSQLTVGCGNEWCRNKYCATCTKDPKDATTAASLLIPLIKGLPKELSLPNPNPVLYLCVDESTSRKRFLAEIVYNELEGKYDLGWCVKAIESEQEDLDKAKLWLDKNAPRGKN
ncbi:ubiquitin fusion degradation protein UFD1-domain-containing protein [Cokeromyces recurvatus]|uniref:ubiquitin fusion degradation protein UFD1-domain-containing protein n=1 Tax=Cokeromyces recurvatus TaxID=90255 RepID=UPI002220DB31|nr:ubiquitin fusion degradation protein UFD1-domain-containing protein [Cokeromyces recurvatus]KAI7897989.1 ubiquitin fusion degradation protein UFD1-domain-containing protein [Cokeromyces recurvatus]